jgi:hypothetical protein
MLLGPSVALLHRIEVCTGQAEKNRQSDPLMRTGGVRGTVIWVTPFGAHLRNVPKISVFRTPIFAEPEQRGCWVSEPSLSEGFRNRLFRPRSAEECLHRNTGKPLLASVRLQWPLVAIVVPPSAQRPAYPLRLAFCGPGSWTGIRQSQDMGSQRSTLTVPEPRIEKPQT